MAISKPAGPNYKPRNIGNPVDYGPGVKPQDPYNDIGTTPDADIPDDGPDSSPNITADRVNRVQPGPPGRGTINLSGYGMPSGFTIGRDRVTCPWCAGPAFDGVFMYAGYEIGWGPIEEIEAVILNGVTRWTNLTEAPHHGVIQTATGTLTTCTPYFGIPTQGVDAQLAAQITGYADTGVITQSGETRGKAYLVMKIAAGNDSGAPTIEVIIKGLKTVLPSNGFASAPVYNDNPAAALWMFLESPLLGRGLKVDPNSVLAIETENDELVNGEKRHTLNLHFDGRQEILNVQEVLSREYADCYVRQAADPAYDLELASARDRPFDMELTEADFLMDGGRPGPRVTGKGTRGQVNRVLGAWMKPRPNDEPWGESWIVVDADPAAIANGTMRVTQEVITLPGYRNYQAAYLRFVERLNAWRLENRNVEWLMRAKGVKIQRGDVIRLQYPLRGYVDYDVRVTGKAYEGPNRWRIFGHNHAPTKYSSTTVTDPDYSTGGTTDPTAPPAVTGLWALDEVPTTGVSAGSLVIRISFTFPEWPHWAGARVRVIGEQDVLGGSNGIVYETVAPYSGEADIEVVTSAVSGVGDYRILVWSRSTLGFESDTPEELIYTPRGKAIPPHDLLRLRAEAIGGEVELEAIYAVDEFDQLGFRYRQSAPGITGQAWDSMTPILNSARGSQNFVVNTIRVTTPGEAQAGQFIEYAAKKVDTGRRESINEQRAQVLLGDGQVQPATTFESWPRQIDWTLNYSLGGGQSDALQPGIGWFFHTETGDHTMTNRYGNGSPAANPDKPHHYNNAFALGGSGILMRSNPDDARFADERVREMSWQMHIDEWDEDANPLPEVSQQRRLDTVYENDLGSGVATGVNALISATDAMEANIFVNDLTVPANWTLMAQAPFVLTGRRTVLDQSDEVSALRDSYPQQVDFDNTGLYRLYVETPIVTATVTTGNAAVAVQNVTNEGFTIVIVTGPATNETVTVQWNARGGAGG